jgi:ubiquinone/menaquinone biosynthesis C-methylase UbiE
MSKVEQAFCRSAPWRAFAQRAVLPWAVRDHALRGEVLEIGGGSGAMARAVLCRFPDVRLTLTELDRAMLSRAARTLDLFPDRATSKKADATSLPFSNAQFDTVLSFLMLHHVIEWEVAVTEVARVLRPGGLFLGYDLADTSLARFTHRVDQSPHRLLSADQLWRQADVVGLRGDLPEYSVAGQVFRFAFTRGD